MLKVFIQLADEIVQTINVILFVNASHHIRIVNYICRERSKYDGLKY